MDNFQNTGLGKYFRILLMGVFFFGAIALLSYQLVFLPQKKKDLALRSIPAVVEERHTFTLAENDMMKEAYKGVMLKKYGIVVSIQPNISSSTPGEEKSSSVKKK